MTTLKPCPNPWCKRTDIRAIRNLGGEFYRTCSRCGLESPCKKTPEEADAAWNHRPGEDAAVEAVAKYVEDDRGLKELAKTIRERFGGKA